MVTIWSRTDQDGPVQDRTFGVIVHYEFAWNGPNGTGPDGIEPLCCNPTFGTRKLLGMTRYLLQRRPLVPRPQYSSLVGQASEFSPLQNVHTRVALLLHSAVSVSLSNEVHRRATGSGAPAVDAEPTSSQAST